MALDRKVIIERENTLFDLGFDLDTIIEIEEKLIRLPPIKTIIESHEYFTKELGLSIDVFRKIPQFLGCGAENMKPKVEYFKNELGIEISEDTIHYLQHSLKSKLIPRNEFLKVKNIDYEFKKYGLMNDETFCYMVAKCPLDEYKKFKKQTQRNIEEKYADLKKQGLIETIPNYIKRRDFGNPFEYYLKNYPGLTLGEVRRYDIKFYDRLKKEFCESIITKKNKQIIKTKKNPEKTIKSDPYEYYLKNYAGMTWGELIQTQRYLYKCLKQNGMMDKLPKNNDRFNDYLVSQYMEYFNSGLTDLQLRNHNPKLYAALSSNGLIKTVFGTNRRKYFTKPTKIY